MGSKPDVLVFIDWYLPAYKAGGPIRSCANMVAHLKTDFDFHFVCSDRDYLDDSAMEGITVDEWIDGPNGESVIYLSPSKRTAKEYRRMIREKRPAHVHINGVFSKEFSILPLQAAKAEKVAIIISARGMLKPSALRIKALKKKAFITVAKWSRLYRKVRWHATDEVEADDIRRMVGQDAIVVMAPNLPRTMPSRSRRMKNKPKGRLKMIYVGRIAREKNMLFAIEVLSEIDPSGLSLDIHGACYDQSYKDRCLEAIDRIGESMSFDLHGGSTPQETLQALEEADALFLPTRGENFGHAILESLMMGTPVIISDTTPWRRLNERGIGADIDLADKSLFRETILRYRDMDTADFEEMSSKAFAAAQAYCNDPEVIRLNKALFSSDG